MVKGRDTSDFTGWLWKPENSRLQRAGRQAAEATGGTQTGCAHPEGLPSAGLWSRGPLVPDSPLFGPFLFLHAPLSSFLCPLPWEAVSTLRPSLPNRPSTQKSGYLTIWVPSSPGAQYPGCPTAWVP